MKKISLVLIAALLSLPGLAQAIKPVALAATPVAPPVPLKTFIKGDMSIRFNTHTQVDNNGKPLAGTKDRYTFNVNVSNSVLFHGTIEQTPYLPSTFGTAQAGVLTYAVDCDVINPANLAQTRNVGKLYGTVPVDDKNVYRFADGNLKISVFGMGAAKGFESKFSGLALGKPPADNGMMAKIKNQALSISRSVNGKTVTIAVTKYDKMEFRSHVLAAGPVMIYPEVTVNGINVYDYGRTAWHFQGVTVTYVVEGRQYQDTISGNVRWVEAADRKTTGKGEYDFDIHVNEPPAGAPVSEAAVFGQSASDEAAFFATDDLVPSLTGTMKYTDTIVGDDTVTLSAVQIDLVGNKLTKQQVMYLCKLLLFSTTVPFNSE